MRINIMGITSALVQGGINGNVYTTKLNQRFNGGLVTHISPGTVRAGKPVADFNVGVHYLQGPESDSFNRTTRTDPIARILGRIEKKLSPKVGVNNTTQTAGIGTNPIPQVGNPNAGLAASLRQLVPPSARSNRPPSVVGPPSVGSSRPPSVAVGPPSVGSNRTPSGFSEDLVDQLHRMQDEGLVSSEAVSEYLSIVASNPEINDWISAVAEAPPVVTSPGNSVGSETLSENLQYFQGDLLAHGRVDPNAEPWEPNSVQAAQRRREAHLAGRSETIRAVRDAQQHAREEERSRQELDARASRVPRVQRNQDEVQRTNNNAMGEALDDVLVSVRPHRLDDVVTVRPRRLRLPLGAYRERSNSDSSSPTVTVSPVSDETMDS